jgi:ATP-binding cassette, subfamily B, bacterial
MRPPQAVMAVWGTLGLEGRRAAPHCTMSTSPDATPTVTALYRNIWHFAAGMRARLVASMSLLAGSQVLKLLVPWAAGQAINTLQAGGAGAALKAGGWIALVLGVHVGAWAMHGPGRVLERSVGVRVRQGVADSLYMKLTRVPLAWHDQRHSGDTQHRVNQASRALFDFAQNQFVYLQSTVNFIGPLAALMLLSPSLGAIALIGYLVVGGVIIRFDRALMQLVETENHAERRYSAGLIDFLGNIATINSLRLQVSSRRLLDKRLQAVFGPLKRSMVLNEVKWCAVELLSVSLTWGLVVLFVWQQSKTGAALMLGSVFMIYQYAQQAGNIVGALASNFQSLARARTDFGSAAPIWQAPERSEDGGKVPPGWRSIELRDLGFDHAQAAQDANHRSAAPLADHAHHRRGALHEVRLALRRGERIALIGASGSGKSTLLRVLAGLYPMQQGLVLVDGELQPGLSHLGGISTLIPQEAEVFEATVRENMTFDMPCEDERLRQAMHVSAFDVVLANMPQGLDTPISERGFNLSGGQRQRLCLARGALAAHGSTLLLLDEPTSALDPVTEAQVFDRLCEAFADACVVSSVHRMSLLGHFDKIVLMAAGRVVDTGTMPELLARQPSFREMMRAKEEKAPAAVALPDPAQAG